MHKVKVVYGEKEIVLDAGQGQNLHKLLAGQGLPIQADCGGHGTCGKCGVRIVEGQMKEPSNHERRLLGKALQSGVRLACLQKVTGDMTVALLSGSEGARILTAGEDVDVFDLEQGYALGVDVGTTTVAAFMMDLQTGKIAATRSGLNLQRPFGGDVVSRCDYAMQHQGGLKELSGIMLRQIRDMAEDMCRELGIGRSQVLRAAIAGNPTMTHLLAELPVNTIVIAPYHPHYYKGFVKSGFEMDVGVAEKGQVYVMPVVSGYVGADTVAAVMAADMDIKEQMSLLIDIGTNGELVLGNRHKLLTCAAAAGPAFEGGKIACGIGGVSGAIDSFSGEKGPQFTTIDHKPAIGICGSGLIDCVATLVKAGCINETGLMEECGDDRFDCRLGNKRFAITDPSQGAAKEVYLSQQDVREVQLAKSAIAAGINILMLRMGIGPADIDALYLAGGFGNYIDYDSACAIGLLPLELREKIIPIGNAAGTGARMCACSKAQRERAQSVADKMEYIELAEAREFSDQFMDNIEFPEAE